MEKGIAHIIFGPIGAGKSTFAFELSKLHKAIKFSTDEWFKTLFFDDIKGMPNLEWTFERITRCENQIWVIAKQLLVAGSDVVLDLGLHRISDRKRFKTLCEEFDIEYQFYFLSADRTIRQKRILKRNEGNGETFDFPVSPEIFEITDRMFEVPCKSEVLYTKHIDTGTSA